MTNLIWATVAGSAILAGYGLTSAVPTERSETVVTLAQAATPVTTPPADASKSPAEASKPPSWVGLPVISADGNTIGQVSEYKASADGKSSKLIVKGTESKTYFIPVENARMDGRAVQLTIKSTDIGNLIQ